MTYPKLSPDKAIALVRAARLYADAVWIGDSDPNLAWLMLVSAIEVAAADWRSASVDPIDLLRVANPRLAAVLEAEYGAIKHSVAVALEPLFKSTRRYLDFMSTFLPSPPPARPLNWECIDWTDGAIKKALGMIYDYRSRALHDGAPFPAPLCQPPDRHDKVFAERPWGEATSTLDGVWTKEDLPMNLHVFAYIVRNALLKWWSASTGNTSPSFRTSDPQGAAS